MQLRLADSFVSLFLLYERFLKAEKLNLSKRNIDIIFPGKGKTLNFQSFYIRQMPIPSHILQFFDKIFNEFISAFIFPSIYVIFSKVSCSFC